MRGRLPGHFGVEIVNVTPGAVDTRLELKPEHLAPNDFLHAATVIAIADTSAGMGCIASLPEEYARQVALVTYGSPIASIFGRFFPEYFGDEAVGGVLAKLSDPAPDVPAWRNFYRRTDPIGGPVFLTPSTADRGSDIELADPMPPPEHPYSPAPGEAPLEHDRPVWTQIAVHSYYLNEPELKHWVAGLKAAMGGQRGE